jgi:hypothetical protein
VGRARLSASLWVAPSVTTELARAKHVPMRCPSRSKPSGSARLARPDRMREPRVLPVTGGACPERSRGIAAVAARPKSLWVGASAPTIQSSAKHVPMRCISRSKPSGGACFASSLRVACECRPLRLPDRAILRLALGGRAGIYLRRNRRCRAPTFALTLSQQVRESRAVVARSIRRDRGPWIFVGRGGTSPERSRGNCDIKAAARSTAQCADPLAASLCAAHTRGVQAAAP